MSIWKLVTSVGTETGLSRDRVVINPVVNVTSGIDDPAMLCSDWATAFESWMGGAVTAEVTVKAYDVKKKPHGPAAASHTINPGSYILATVPREVALCLSFFSGFNVKRQRGRLYVPAFLLPTKTMGARPSAQQIAEVAALAGLLETLGPPDTDWSVYSTVDGVARKVTNWFVDNEWDTQRKRGQRSTTRQSGTTNE